MTKAEKLLKAVYDELNREMTANASRGGFGAGLSREGFAGGYFAALNDMELALRGIAPGGRYADAWSAGLAAVRKKRA